MSAMQILAVLIFFNRWQKWLGRKLSRSPLPEPPPRTPCMQIRPDSRPTTSPSNHLLCQPGPSLLMPLSFPGLWTRLTAWGAGTPHSPRNMILHLPTSLPALHLLPAKPPPQPLASSQKRLRTGILHHRDSARASTSTIHAAP